MTNDSTKTHVPPTENATEPGVAGTDTATNTAFSLEPSFGRFGQYDLLDAFAGGMAIVYRARHRVLPRTVALKVLNPGRPLSAADRARFETEAKAVELLNHSHIIKVREYGEQDGKPYFTMDFIEGGSLRDRVGDFKGQPQRAAALVERIARAVQQAHEQNILHRDLKPGNILMRGPDDPVVADFGLAKMLDGDASLTKTGTVLGTPAYMAPEQLQGRNHDFGPETDVWALGVILHELLTGRRPFPGSTHEEVASTALTTEAIPPSQIEPSVPPELDIVVLRCLSRDPADRYASAGQLADHLKGWLAGKRLPKRPLTRARRRRRRRAIISIAATLMLALAAIGGGLLWWRSLDHEEKLRQELALNGKVELVGPTGPPRSYRILTDNIEILPPAEDGIFTFKCDRTGLFEVMKTTGQDRFRFRAEVQYFPQDQGVVALYVGREGFPPDKNEWNCFVTSGFTRCSPTPDGRPQEAFEFLTVYRPQDGSPRGDRRPISTRPCQFDPEPLDRWRVIEFNVSRDVIATTAGSDLQYAKPRTQLMALAEPRAEQQRPIPRENLDGVTPTFDPLGGIGIYVSGAKVRIRNVTVEVVR
jgi:serine/threonine protein kinase